MFCFSPGRNFQDGSTFSVFGSAVNSVISNSQPQTTGLRMRRLWWTHRKQRIS